MTWGSPKMLWLVFLLLPCLFLLIWGQRRLFFRLRLFAQEFGKNSAGDRRNSPYMFLKILCAILTILALIAALAMPRFGFTWQEQKSVGRDVFIALDVSASMGATDLSPSRLVHAKRKIRDLLARLQGTRVGLVIFAGQAFVQFPLTEDLAAAQLFLDLIEPEMITARGTAVGTALRLALQSFERLAKNTAPGQKAIILLTDGEDKSSDPLGAANDAQSKKIPIHILGIGTSEGAPVPDVEGSFKKDSSGNLIMSRLNPESLKKIAEISGGMYVHSTVTDDDLNALFTQGLFEPGVSDYNVSTQKKKIWNEVFVWPLGMALVSFLFMLYFRRKEVLIFSKIISGLGLALLAASFYASPGQAEAKKGIDAFNKKNYAEASREFLQDEIDHPHDPLRAYNRGVADYMLGDYERAAEAFSKAKKTKNPEIRRQATFNLGNALAHQKKWDEAIKTYDEVLDMNKNDAEAAENKTWAQQMQEAEKQKEKNKQDKQDQKDKQNSEDKQDQQDKQSSKDKQDQQDQQNSEAKQDQQDQQNSKDQQDQQDQQNSKDKQDQQDQQNSKDQQDKQNSKDKQGQQDKQNSEDKQGQQDKQNSEDKQGQQDKQNSEDKQDQQDKQSSGDKQDQKPKEEKDKSQKDLAHKDQEHEAKGKESEQKGLGVPTQELNNMETERLLRALPDRGPPINYLPMSPEKPSKQAEEEDW